LAKADPSLPPRRVAPATARTFALPTVAALLMVAAAACSSRSADEDVQADRVHRIPIGSSTATPSSSPSIGGATIIDPIEPDPRPVRGESAMVVPTVPKGPPKHLPPVPPPPIVKPHHLGGAAAITHTF
jgi:hypothetical protein